jgi:hypothetical protein
MSSSDARMFDALAERVAGFERGLAGLAAEVAVLREAVLGKVIMPDVYGSEPDHGADREARAALLAKRRDRGA